MEKKELKELLIKCWMTHDGMWFYHCQQECGMEITNKINKAAIRSMSRIEINRIVNMFKIGEIETFKDLQNLIKKTFELFKAEFMKFEYSFPSTNKMRFEMHKCFAYDGIKRIGVLDQYDCGIYDRIEGWFNSLNIKYKVTPEINGCLIHNTGECVRNYMFSFKE